MVYLKYIVFSYFVSISNKQRIKLTFKNIITLKFFTNVLQFKKIKVIVEGLFPNKVIFPILNFHLFYVLLVEI